MTPDNAKFIKACVHEIQNRECRIRMHRISMCHVTDKIQRRRLRNAINAEELSIASLKLSYAGWTGSTYERDYA